MSSTPIPELPGRKRRQGVENTSLQFDLDDIAGRKHHIFRRFEGGHGPVVNAADANLEFIDTATGSFGFNLFGV
jgi:hypothetical protein